MPSARLDATYRVNPAVAHREIEGQVLLLLPDHHDLFTLNDTGRLVWRNLVAGGTAAATAEELARLFDVPLVEARADVVAMLEDLLAAGILVAP